MNERTPQVPPVIAPVKEGVIRPLWSVMIPTYNCSSYLRETLQSVLSNDPGSDKMQIEVVDDCSIDADVKSLVEEIGQGRVLYYRQSENVGSLRNFETCINRAKGEWVHILHGDDMICKSFYNEIELLFLSYPEAGAAFTGLYYIDEESKLLSVNEQTPKNTGIIKDWLAQIATQNFIQPPAMVVKRAVYEKLGSFFAVHYGEDWEMWARIAAYYPVAYSDKKLAKYRYLRNNSISNSSLRSGQNARDILKIIDIINGYLPENQKKNLKKTAKKNYANYFANCAQLIYKSHTWKAALEQALLALKMHVNHTTILSIIKLFIKKCINYRNIRTSKSA